MFSPRDPAANNLCDPFPSSIQDQAFVGIDPKAIGIESMENVGEVAKGSVTIGHTRQVNIVYINYGMVVKPYMGVSMEQIKQDGVRAKGP